MLTGFKISQDYLEVVIGRVDKGRASRSLAGSKDPRLRLVTGHSIHSTAERYPKCRCESMGLHPDMTIDQLTAMGSGCTDDWVCGRLDSIRRLNGH